MEKIRYIGCFFNVAELEKKLGSYDRTPLYRAIAMPHVTFSFRPQSVPWEMVGKPIGIKAVGYGCNGENEALSVEIISLPKELEQMAKEISAPHITLTVSKEGKAVNSSKLSYSPITPFEIQGIFGAVDEEDHLYTELKEE